MLQFCTRASLAANILLAASPGVAMVALCRTSAAQQIDVAGTPSETFYSLTARGDTILAGSGNVLWISTDRGTTWTASSTIKAEANSVDAILATDYGWFAGCFGYGVFRSVDRGETWTAMNSGLSGLGALYVTDFEVWGNVLYASTDGAGVFRLDLTSPSSWQKFGTEFQQYVAETVTQLAMHGDDLVAAAGGNGYVFSRDLNSGPWVPTQLSGHILSVANTATEIVATSARSAFFTYDGGATWTEKGPFSNSGFYAVAASTGAALKQPAVFIASASNAGRSELYRSVDAGESWELADTLTETLDMLTYSDRIYLAQADGLRVWPINTSSGTAGYGSSSPGVRLFPPMPNPVGDQAEIRYAVDRPGGLRIELFDALGRRVAVLLDEFVSSGVAKVILQTGRLTPGHYFMHARHGTGVATQSISVVR